MHAFTCQLYFMRFPLYCVMLLNAEARFLTGYQVRVSPTSLSYRCPRAENNTVEFSIPKVQYSSDGALCYQHSVTFTVSNICRTALTSPWKATILLVSSSQCSARLLLQ